MKTLSKHKKVWRRVDDNEQARENEGAPSWQEPGTLQFSFLPGAAHKPRVFHAPYALPAVAPAPQLEGVWPEALESQTLFPMQLGQCVFVTTALFLSMSSIAVRVLLLEENWNTFYKDTETEKLSKEK